MTEKTKGFCRYCKKEYTKAGMLRHLQTCAERKRALEEKNGKSGGYFELVLSGKENQEYWLIIEMKEAATLRDLDQFIRDIWVECCGHLSAFLIQGNMYEVYCDPDDFFDYESYSMDVRLKDILMEGMKFSYRYDYGSTTELLIKVQSFRRGRGNGDTITILSRNQPPKILCSVCGTRLAQWTEPEGWYKGTPFWCDECLEESEREEEDGDDWFEKIVLPVCNSPRMGVCGYEGSECYPDEFIPDHGGKDDDCAEKN